MGLNKMKNKVKDLLDTYLSNKKNPKISCSTFLNYLESFTACTDFHPISNKKVISLMDNNVKNIFYTLHDPSDSEMKLIYTLLKLSQLKKQTTPEFKKNEKIVEQNEHIRKGALGFKIGVFDDFNIHKIKNETSPHKYEVIFEIYQMANIYLKLKSCTEFSSKSHMFFYEIVKEELKTYEQKVLEQRCNVSYLEFYVNLYQTFLRLKFINQINECFKENPYKSIEYYKDNLLVKRIIGLCVKPINEMINSFINTGNFKDPQNEFFIVKNCNENIYSLDYGRIPYFVSKNIAEKILYTGKTIYFINKIEPFELEYDLCILNENFEYVLKNLIYNINKKMYAIFILKHNVKEILNQAKDIFLFNRSDFIETLFFLLKDFNSNKSITYILETALQSTFYTSNNFLKSIDVCILENECDYISLFCRLDFPENIIFTKEIVMKYVAIFKFLWKIKKIENSIKQLKRKEFDNKIKIIQWQNLLYILYSYIFDIIETEYLAIFEHLKHVDAILNNENNPVIEINDVKDGVFQNELVDYNLIDNLKNIIHKSLDNILNKIFQMPNSGKREIDLFIASLESLTIGLSRLNVNTINDDEVKINLKDFLEKNQEIVNSIILKNLAQYI